MGHKRLPEVGVNDLATLHPELAETLLLPELGSQLTVGSQAMVGWLCVGSEDAPHPRFEWQGPTAVRVKGHKCGVCSNRVALPGWNDLETLRPDLSPCLVRPSEAREVTVGSSRKLAWWCEGTATQPHPWFGWYAPVKIRARGNGCRVCAGLKVIPGWNDLETLRPRIAAQLVSPDEAKSLSLRSNLSRRWWCEGSTEPHPRFEWDAPVAGRVLAKYSCPQCAAGRAFDPSGEGWVYSGHFSSPLGEGIFFGKTNDPTGRVGAYFRPSSGLSSVRNVWLFRVGQGADATEAETRLLALMASSGVPSCGDRGFRAPGVTREGFFVADASASFMSDFQSVLGSLGPSMLFDRTLAA